MALHSGMTFNPTVVRIHEHDRKVGMVINNSALDSSYFQIYELNPGGTRCTTFLEYAMPWNTCADAILDFEAWMNCESDDMPFPHSWCGSREERQADEAKRKEQFDAELAALSFDKP